VIEKTPLGTGGGIKLALNKTKSKNVFILNGDTYFPIDLRNMAKIHTSDTALTVATKTLFNIERYGLVNIDEEQNINSFVEKKLVNKDLINDGIYILRSEERRVVQTCALPI